MTTEDREFLLRLVNGHTSIFSKGFSKEADAKEAVGELNTLMEQIKKSLAESEKERILDLESAINAAENEACIQAYLDGMVMGAKIIYTLLKQED